MEHRLSHKHTVSGAGGLLCLGLSFPSFAMGRKTWLPLLRWDINAGESQRPPLLLNCSGYCVSWGFPGGASGNHLAYQCRSCRRCGFNPWVGRITWRRAWQPTPVFLPEKSPWTEEPGGLQSIESQRVRQDWSDVARPYALFPEGFLGTPEPCFCSDLSSSTL